MSDLAAFLLERIAEDEAEDDREYIARQDPARVLRQCAALRVVVEDHEESQGGDCLRCVEDWASDDRAPWPCPTLRALASIWSDHPNYREEWAL